MFFVAAFRRQKRDPERKLNDHCQRKSGFGTILYASGYVMNPNTVARNRNTSTRKRTFLGLSGAFSLGAVAFSRMDHLQPQETKWRRSCLRTCLMLNPASHLQGESHWPRRALTHHDNQEIPAYVSHCQLQEIRTCLPLIKSTIQRSYPYSYGQITR